MKFLNVAISALLFVACGTQNNTQNNNSEDLVKAEGITVPKSVLLVTDLESNEVKAYEVDASLVSEEAVADLSDAEKEALVAQLVQNQISTKILENEFSLNESELEIPTKNSVEWFGGFGFGIGGFYGYGFGYRFPYSYGFGFPYGGFGYGFYRPAFGYGLGYYW